MFGTVVHVDIIYVKFKGQGRRSKFMLTQQNTNTHEGRSDGNKFISAYPPKSVPENYFVH